MRIAALYDIHGNLPALEAVVADVLSAHVDQVLVGGDVVAGPMPGATLAFLQRLSVPVQFIRGNADREVASPLSAAESNALPEAIRESTRWVAEQLSPEQRQTLWGWPETRLLSVAGRGDVLFCHATPRSDTAVFTRLTSEDRLRPAFADPGVSLVVCGHTHMQFERRIGPVTVVNAGSVGMPYGEPGAYWLLLDTHGIEFRRTVYDFPEAAERVRATHYPHAEDFAANNLLHPPTEAEALDVFTRLEPASYS